MPDPPNATIAALFDELADLYELDGAIVHRVVAYRTAAKAVRESPVSIAALTREGRVTEVAGIGKTLEEKIQSLLDTGTIPAVEKLRTKFPPGLVDMTRLPGLGPKRARRLFDELGIDSLPALREAAEQERLGGGARVGQKFGGACAAWGRSSRRRCSRPSRPASTSGRRRGCCSTRRSTSARGSWRRCAR